MEVVMVLATVVSALGALGALWFARDTVRKTRAMRHEERLARLPELVAELGETATLIRQDPFQRELYEVRRFRLAAMLKGTPEELPSPP
jgi:hypothetical protein